jgi:hypothetical protein
MKNGVNGATPGWHVNGASELYGLAHLEEGLVYGSPASNAWAMKVLGRSGLGRMP